MNNPTPVMVGGRYVERPGTARLANLASECNQAVGRLRSLQLTPSASSRAVEDARQRVRDLTRDYHRELAALSRSRRARRPRR